MWKICVSFCISLFFFISFSKSTQETQTQSLPSSFPNTPSFYWSELKPVPILEWSPDKEFANEISSKRSPVLLKNTVVSKWSALSKWTEKYLIEKIPYKQTVTEISSHVYTYFDNAKSMGSLMNVGWLERGNEKTIPMREFFDLVSKAGTTNDNHFHYFSRKLSEFPRILADVDPDDFLQVRKEPTRHHVWIGSNNITAQTHYDLAQNFFVQISGHKTFLLASPQYIDNVHTFPNLHPHARQSQIQFHTYSNLAQLNVKYPNYKPIPEVFFVTLQPGDVLYLPPCWLHRVIANDLSVSVNYWSGVPEEDIYFEKIRKQNLAFVDKMKYDFDQNQLQLLVKIYFDRLSDKISSLNSELIAKSQVGGAHALITKIFERNFFPLFGKLLGINDRKRKAGVECDELLLAYCQRSFTSETLGLDEQTFQQIQTELNESVDLVAPLFVELSTHVPETRPISEKRAVFELMLGKYFEMNTNEILGTSSVVEFFQVCW